MSKTFDPNDVIYRCTHCGWLHDKMPTFRCPECDRTKFVTYSPNGWHYDVETLLFDQSTTVSKPKFPSCPFCHNTESAQPGIAPDNSQMEKYLHCGSCGRSWIRPGQMREPTLEQRVEKLEGLIEVRIAAVLLARLNDFERRLASVQEWMRRCGFEETL